MHKRLGVTHYVSTSCSCVLCMPNACTVRVVQQCCLLPISIKPVSLVARFSWLALLQVRIPHCGYPKMLLWKDCVHPHCHKGNRQWTLHVWPIHMWALETTCDMYCRLWLSWRWRSPMNYTALASSPLAPLYYSLPESFQRTCNMKRMPVGPHSEKALFSEEHN